MEDRFELLNMELRTMVIARSILLEEITREMVESIIRMTKSNNKTLGNNFSALSFKHKVDLLHDLDMFNDDVYKDLIKIAEIRNQFVHNFKANSFESLKEINKECFQYLKKGLPKGVEGGEEFEKELKMSFLNIFDRTYQELRDIKAQLFEGIVTEVLERISHYAFKDIDSIWEKAKTVSLTEITSNVPRFTPEAFDIIFSNIKENFEIELARYKKEKSEELNNMEKIKAFFSKKPPKPDNK